MTAHTGSSSFRVGARFETVGTKGAHGHAALAFTFDTSADGGGFSIVAPAVTALTLAGASAGSLTLTAASTATLTLTGA